MGNNLAGQLDEHEPQLMSILDAEMDARKYLSTVPDNFVSEPLTRLKTMECDYLSTVPDDFVSKPMTQINTMECDCTMDTVPNHLRLVGYTDEDVEKGRVPVKMEFVTNGFVVEASRHFESNQDLAAYLFKITNDDDYTGCNQKSLRRKIADTVTTAKKRRKNKNLKRLIPYLEAEFRAPVKSEPQSKPSLTQLLRENDALKRRVTQQESALEELQEKYDDAIQKLKKVCH